jgi:hypothetical protein
MIMVDAPKLHLFLDKHHFTKVPPRKACCHNVKSTCLMTYRVFLYDCAAVNIPELQDGLLGSPLALGKQILMDKSVDNKKVNQHGFGF